MIAGSTTVADHFKRLEGPEFYTQYPIEVLYTYGRTWTPREPTAWGDDIRTEYGRAVRLGEPYVIHLAEGVDAEAAHELDVLTEAGALGRNTMIIHGVALRSEDVEAIARAKASVCWCPASNLYLYDRTADVRALSCAGVNVTLGTDSTMTGGLNLLDEVRIGRRAYREQTGEDAPQRWLVQIMTTHAAYALLREDRLGRIAVGYDADLLVLPDTGKDPYATLIEAEPDDIALLIHGGVPVYGDEAYISLFERFTPAFASVLVSGKPKLVAGDLPGLLNRISEKLGRTFDLPFLPCVLPKSDPR
jgi:cytosine/adenosine deaminase-related metal-dependent hydrolase